MKRFVPLLGIFTAVTMFGTIVAAQDLGTPDDLPGLIFAWGPEVGLVLLIGYFVWKEFQRDRAAKSEERLTIVQAEAMIQKQLATQLGDNSVLMREALLNERATNQRFTNQQQELTELKLENAELQSQLTELTRRLNEVEEDADKVPGLEGRISSLETQLSVAKAASDTASGDRDKYMKQVEELREQLALAEAQRDAYKEMTTLNDTLVVDPLPPNPDAEEPPKLAPDVVPDEAIKEPEYG